MNQYLRRAAAVLFLLLAPALGISDTAAQTTQSRVSTFQGVAAYKGALQKQLSSLSAQSITATSLLDQKISSVWENDEWKLDGRTDYVYNELGRVAAWHYVWVGSDWVSESVTKTTPGGDGYTVTTNEQYDPETNEWIPIDQTRVDFLNDPGSGEPFINVILYQEWSGDEWVDVERETFSYSTELEIQEIQTDFWDGTSWIPEARTIVTEDGPDVLFVDAQWNGTSWEMTSRIFYRDVTIEGLQQRLMEIGDDIADYDEVMYGLHLIPAGEAQEWDGEEWVNMSRQRYTYELFTGAIAEIITEVWDEGEWIQAYQLDLTYESTGKLSSLSFDYHTGESWIPAVVETYTRDDEGSISEITQQMDLGTGLENSVHLALTWNHTGTSVEDGEVPRGFALDPAYPNPFNPQTHLTYRMAAAGHVGVRVYDTLGRQVATLVDEIRPAGAHVVTFDGEGLPSGQYIVRLDAPGFSQARVVTLLK